MLAVKIIPSGPSVAIIYASWPAPLGSVSCFNARLSAARTTSDRLAGAAVAAA
jgi:hypothetical protein